MKAIQDYIAKRRGKKPRTSEIAELLFVGKKGLPVVWEQVQSDGRTRRSDAVKCRFDRLCKRAGMKRSFGVGFYILRHTYATLIGEQSTDPREVQAAMAHLTVQQQQTYRHDMAMKAQAAQWRLRETALAKLPTLRLKPAGSSSQSQSGTSAGGNA